jgi:hypothetical protein
MFLVFYDFRGWEGVYAGDSQIVSHPQPSTLRQRPISELVTTPEK